MSTDNIPLEKRTASTWHVDPKIQELVDKFMQENPDKYSRAQDYGEFLMNTRFADVNTMRVNTEDNEGDEILYLQIINNVKNYGFTSNDLQEYEINVLIKKLGNDWKNVLKTMVEENGQ